MYRAGRRTRASAEDLYKQCFTGDCPPDVKNKIEGDTWADRLLKWFGSVIYLGGLGIGTGRGSGGSTGYRPIGGTTRPIPDTIPVRPAVPVEPIGPVEIIPIDTINPAGPSVIDFTNVQIPDPSIIDIANPTTALGPGEIDIVSATDPIGDLGGVGGNPTVITSVDDTAAILDVQPIPPPKRFALDVNNEPRSGHVTVYSSTTHPDPDINIFVSPNYQGEIVGDVEEIPLTTFSEMAEFEIMEPGPQTSTPTQIVERLAGNARRLYNRLFEQVPTRNPYFLGPVSRAVQFEYSNPVFDADVTVTFENDLAEIAAAPDSDFRDVQILHRPTYTTTDQGFIRVSREGARASITTRSGLQLGRPVHFYQDLSAIESAESFEMHSLNTTSHSSTTVNTLLDSITVNPAYEDPFYPDDELLDPLDETFQRGHIVLTETNVDGDIIQFPTTLAESPVKVFINDYGSSITVSYPHPAETASKIIPIPSTDNTPLLVLDLTSDDYFLHPSLRKRKRKRSDVF